MNFAYSDHVAQLISHVASPGATPVTDDFNAGASSHLFLRDSLYKAFL